jgi:hypothetical protein
MANNPALFNGVIAALCGTNQNRNLLEVPDTGIYAAWELAVRRFATALDAAIATDPSLSQSEVDLLVSLVEGAMADRFVTDPDADVYAPVVDGIVQLYTLFKSQFEPLPTPVANVGVSYMIDSVAIAEAPSKTLYSLGTYFPAGNYGDLYQGVCTWQPTGDEDLAGILHPQMVRAYDGEWFLVIMNPLPGGLAAFSTRFKVTLMSSNA